METKQTIHLDENNKLVVNTNQGVVEGKESYAIIQGEFIIKAEDVAKLLSMINEKNMFSRYALFASQTKWYIGDANDLTQQFECEIKLRKEGERIIEDKKREYLILDEENTRLLRKINKFNLTRHWWERKFKIDEE
jgi:hypothetical protein